MKTITFYSYKGGVGRTLALSNIAKRLAEFDKKVCILDFDLEAPGLHIKLENYLPKKKKVLGIVDYIYEFSTKGSIPSDISSYTTKLKTNNIFFIPAGNPLSNNYWMKLAQINWWKLFYSSKSEGIPFFLDLKEKINLKYKPDYLLIDSRTGISELSSITISILADSVIFFSANNKENIQGCKQVLKGLSDERNNLFNSTKDIHFVLSRIPSPQKPDEKTKEAALTSKIFSEFNEFKENQNIEFKSFNVLHSDRDLELEEGLKIGYDFDKTSGIVSKEYLNLFNNITQSDLSPEEKTQFNNIRESQMIITMALAEENINSKIDLLDKALKLNPKNTDVYFHKGWTLFRMERFEEAIKEFEHLIKREKISLDGYIGRAISNYRLKKYKESLKDIELALDVHKFFDIENLHVIIKDRLNFTDEEVIRELDSLVEKYPNKSNAYNTRSNFYRKRGNFTKALEDIYKALELDTENGLAYSTLAEIKANQNEIPEFYRNFELALKYSLDLNDFFDDDIYPIYKPFFKEERFQKLLEKYNKVAILNKIKKINN